MTAEIRERLSDELDYEQEAQAQRAFARAWREHPFVVVPDVVTSLSRERVLVTEWVEGLELRGGQASCPAAERDRFGEIVFRFFFGSLYRNGHFSGDPHPGNFKLMPDGRVAFLDFGMTKRLGQRAPGPGGRGHPAGHGGRRRGPARAPGAAWASSPPTTPASRPTPCSTTSATSRAGTSRTAR